MNKLLYFENSITDPAYNLALEEYLLVHRRKSDDCLLLWKNEPTVVVGRNQDTLEEVNIPFAEEHAIHIVRRISGGGAVYHDLGNLNFSFLANDSTIGFDFTRFTEPVIRTLRHLGVSAENSGRNDIVTDGKKISGNAQYKHRGRMLHHGTILFNSDLNRLSEVLKVSPEKYNSKAIASVRSRVTNVLDHLKKKITIEEFQREVWKNIQRDSIVQQEHLNDEEKKKVEKLRLEKYKNQMWNFGPSSLSWNHRGMRKFDWGTIDVRLEIQKGMIKTCFFYGDFFCLNSSDRLSAKMTGLLLERGTLAEKLSEHDIQEIFPELSKEQFLEVVLNTSASSMSTGSPVTINPKSGYPVDTI